MSSNKKGWEYATKGAALGAGLGAIDHAISGAMAGYAAGGKAGALRGAATSSIYGAATGTLEGGLIGAGVDFFSKHKKKIKKLKRKLHKESVLHPKTERGKKILHSAAKGGLFGIATGGVKGVIAGGAAGYKLGGRAALMTGAKTGGKFGAATGILSGALVGAGIAASEKKKKHKIKAAHTEEFQNMKTFSQLREELDYSLLTRLDEDTLDEWSLKGYGKAAGAFAKKVKRGAIKHQRSIALAGGATAGLAGSAYLSHQRPVRKHHREEYMTELNVDSGGAQVRKNGTYENGYRLGGPTSDAGRLYHAITGKRTTGIRVLKGVKHGTYNGPQYNEEAQLDEFVAPDHRTHYAHPMHLHLHKGAFHRWLGKSEDEPITDADIQKGLRAGGHAAKMANMARMFKHKWHHK